MTNEVKKIVDEDIEKCKQEIKSGNKDSRSQLFRILLSKYGPIIDGFKDELFPTHYDESGNNKLRNLELMQQKLELFKAMGYENKYADNSGDSGFVINNTNKMDMKFNITFADARSAIEGMTALKEAEIEEILEKVNELEQIVNSTERKTKKWEKANGIIKWVADKSIDVGLALLPLILQLG